MYSQTDIEQVFSIYKDESQDPEYISDNTDIELDTVIGILNQLNKEGRIKSMPFETKPIIKVEESRIILLTEMISDEIKKELRVGQLTKSPKDENYFFQEKTVNKAYDAVIFHIEVEKVYLEQDMIYIPVKLFFKDKEFEYAVLMDRHDDVYYLDMENKETVDDIKKVLKRPNWKILTGLTSFMLEDLVPEDFWEVRATVN